MRITTDGRGFVKWDVLLINGKEYLVIDINKNNLKIYPFTASKYKVITFLKFNWLRLKIFLRLI